MTSLYSIYTFTGCTYVLGKYAKPFKDLGSIYYVPLPPYSYGLEGYSDNDK